MWSINNFTSSVSQESIYSGLVKFWIKTLWIISLILQVHFSFYSIICKQYEIKFSYGDHLLSVSHGWQTFSDISWIRSVAWSVLLRIKKSQTYKWQKKFLILFWLHMFLSLYSDCTKNLLWRASLSLRDIRQMWWNLTIALPGGIKVSPRAPYVSVCEVYWCRRHYCLSRDRFLRVSEWKDLKRCELISVH